MVSRSLLLLFTVAFAAQLGLGLISPLLPLYAQSLGASGLWVGIIFSTFALSRFFINPIIGRYSDVHGRRRFIIIGLGAYALLSLTYIAANTPESLSVVRFAHGASSALVIPVAMAYAGDLAPKGWEGRYMSLFHVAMSLGVGFGPFIGGVFSDAYGMNSAFIIMGLLALANLVFVIKELPESAATQKGIHREPYRKILTDRIVQALLAHRFIIPLGQSMVMGFMPIYAVVELGLPISAVGLVLSSRWLTRSVIQYPFGILADRYNRVVLVLIGGSVFVAALITMPLAADAAQLLSINVIGAIGSALSGAGASAIIASRGREMGMGTVMGLINAGDNLGMATGPIIAGLVFDIIGLVELFYVGGIIAAIGFLLFYLLMRRHRAM